jgi:hypothetical protein
VFRLLAAAAASALWSVACTPHWIVSYRGTASVETSRAPPELSFQSASLTICRPAGTGDPPLRFAILAIGTRCTIDGTWLQNTFLPAVGDAECLLASAGGTRTLRVTEATAHLREQSLEAQVGGDDAERGEHVLLRFSGTVLTRQNAGSRCDEVEQRLDPPADDRYSM